MANQFDARLTWRRSQIWTADEETGAYAVITWDRANKDRPWHWIVCPQVGAGQEGRSKSEQAARNAVRVRIVKLPSCKGQTP